MFSSHRQKAKENSELEALLASFFPPVFSLFRGLPPQHSLTLSPPRNQRVPLAGYWLTPHIKRIYKICAEEGWGRGRQMGTPIFENIFPPPFLRLMLSSRARLFSKVFMEHSSCWALREVRRGQSDKSPGSRSTPSRQGETKRQGNGPFVGCSYTLWRRGWGVGYNFK